MSQGGHRLLPHTADLIISAWAPTREECIDQAVAGLVASFADLRGLTAHETLTFAVPPADDEEQLVRVLDEVIYLLDARRILPRSLICERADAGVLVVRVEAVPVADARSTGPLPKAISRHRLRFGPGRRGWSCAVTVDV